MKPLYDDEFLANYRFMQQTYKGAFDERTATSKMNEMYCKQNGPCDKCKCRSHTTLLVSDKYKCPICGKPMTFDTWCKERYLNDVIYTAGCLDCNIFMALQESPYKLFEEDLNSLFENELNNLYWIVSENTNIDDYKKYRIWCVANNISPKKMTEWYVSHKNMHKIKTCCIGDGFHTEGWYMGEGMDYCYELAGKRKEEFKGIE